MSQNKFNRDMNRERIISDFILTNGAELFKKRGYLIFRNSDRELQHKGIDLLIQNKRKLGDPFFHVVDEKSATSHVAFNDNPNAYSEHTLFTFAFELDFENPSFKRVPGWLFKEDIDTEYYLLTWIWVKGEC